MRRNYHSHRLEHRKRCTRTDFEKHTRARGERGCWEKSERQTAWSRTEIEKQKEIFCGWENTCDAALDRGLACRRGSIRMRSSSPSFSSYYGSIVVHVSQWRLWSKDFNRPLRKVIVIPWMGGNSSRGSGTEIRLSRETKAVSRAMQTVRMLLAARLGFMWIMVAIVIFGERNIEE